MAADNPFEQDDPKKKQLGEQDPLFYEGKTPVLGEDVALTEPTGEIAFPEASQAAPTGTEPSTTSGTQWPAFPEFNLERPAFQFEPGTPPTAPDMLAPQPPTAPWWSQALDVVNAGESAYSNLQELGAAPAEGLWPTVNPSEFGMYADEGAPWYGGPGGEGTGGFNLTGEGATPESAMSEGVTGLGKETGLNWGGAVMPGLQTAAGLYGLYSGITEDNPTTMAMAAPQVVGGAASTAAALAPSALGALAPGMAALGPVAGVMTLPMIAGMLYNKYGPGSRDKIRTPPGFSYVPGTGNSRGVGGLMVDPASGRMIQYQGNGKYSWADESKQGIPATPEQFKQWGIEPTGRLAQIPEYAAINKQIRDEDIAQAGTFQPGTTVPRTPTEAHQRSYLEEWRQPYIDRIKAQYPTAGEGEIWRLYTLTPEYQQELNMKAQWGPTGQPGEVSEGGTGESNAPGGEGAPSGGGAENY